MHPPLNSPIIYQISAGETDQTTTSDSASYKIIVEQAAAAVGAGITCFQIREKLLSTRVLFELVEDCVSRINGAEMKLFVNERADVAVTAGADGVHLTSHSAPTSRIRDRFGDHLLIGVSTHSVAEVEEASNSGADFVTFGPVFHTPAKSGYGQPAGVEMLALAAKVNPRFPVVALGGITCENAGACVSNGAHGIAAIRLFGEPKNLVEIVNRIKAAF